MTEGEGREGERERERGRERRESWTTIVKGRVNLVRKYQEGRGRGKKSRGN